ARIVSGAIVAMGRQTDDLAAVFAADGAGWSVLKIDGGMAANDWMAQDIADVTGLEVIRPDFVETTALGAAMLASVGAGIHPSLEAAAAAMIGPARHFRPQMPAEARAGRIAAWRAALAGV